jgi:hypothetical protein
MLGSDSLVTSFEITVVITLTYDHVNLHCWEVTEGNKIWIPFLALRRGGGGSVSEDSVWFQSWEPVNETSPTMRGIRDQNEMRISKQHRLVHEVVQKPLNETDRDQSKRPTVRTRTTGPLTDLFWPVHSGIVHVFYIARETAICRNPPLDNFTGDRKNLIDP